MQVRAVYRVVGDGAVGCRHRGASDSSSAHVRCSWADISIVELIVKIGLIDSSQRIDVLPFAATVEAAHVLPNIAVALQTVAFNIIALAKGAYCAIVG